MANNVKIRFKNFLPGAGRDSAGDPKQGKTRVVGEINVTSYGGSGGEPFSATDIGLTTIDAINLRVTEEVTGDFHHTAGDSAPRRSAVYAKDSGHFYVYTTNGEGVVSSYIKTDTETLEFDAFGDSADDVELT